jgi:UTP--glucose-1-phosphate uridylyltransferase
VSRDPNRSNVVEGLVEPPAPGDVAPLPRPGTAGHRALVERGEQALRRGEVGLVVLAGGMATRMGGVVKALVEAVDDRTFLAIRLAEMDALERAHGRRPPLLLMTSQATDGPIRSALGDRVDGERVGVFTQGTDLRRTLAGDVFLDASGNPSPYAPGHGDLVDALRDSGLLAAFREGGGRTLMLANLDNLGATLDPALVGWHLGHGAPLTGEVVDLGSDRGGIPVRWNGRPVILEDFRVPAAFDRSAVGVFNTNTFHVDADALADHAADWTWFAVRKEVDGQPVLQFERLLGELTSHLDTRFVRVPRDGVGSRFLPVKDADELARRQPELRAVLTARGILP